MKVIGYIYAWVLILFMVVLVISWIIALIKSIVCFGRKNCQIENCPIRDFCSKKARSSKETEKLKELVERSYLNEKD